MTKLKNESSIPSRVCQHLLAIGVSTSEANRVTRLVEKWNRDSGPEWTVTRFKNLKAALIQMLATKSDYKVPPGWATRMNRKGKTIFADGLIHSMFMNAATNLKLVEAFLRLYQVLELNTLSKVQEDKMVKAIELPPSVSIASLLERIKTFQVRSIHPKEVLHLQEIGQKSRTLMNFIGGTKTGPYFTFETEKSWTFGGTHTRYDELCFDFEEYFSYDRAAHALWEKYPEEVSLRWIGNESYPFIERYEKLVDAPAGALAAIQEGGCKVRWIANPLLSLQVLGEPLKDKLYAYSQMAYPQKIFSEDHDGGREDVFKWLSEKRTVYSYDCTSFTDRFPLALQEFALLQLREKGITNDFDMDAFDVIMKKDWYAPMLGRTVRWGVGQPLGYGPSFHLATISHAMILDCLDENRTGLWRVVGDDVVIADHALAMAYSEFMTGCAGVTINHSKSVISAEIAEFLGKLILPGGVNPSMKVKLLGHPDQVVRAIAFYGQEAIEVLDGKQREFSLTCFLPEYFGGLGLRPKGMSNAKLLSQFNLSRMASAMLKSDLSSFHGVAPKGGHTETKALLELKDKILELNTKTISLLGLSEIQTHLGANTHINMMTHLPTRNMAENGVTPNPECCPLVRPTQGWVSLQDKAWSLQTSDQSCSQYAFTTPLNGMGYIDHRETPSTLTIDDGPHFTVKQNERKSHDSQFHSQYKDYYTDWREFLKEISTACAESSESHKR